MRAEAVLDARCGLGEGPVWDEREGRLYFVDIMACRVLRWDPATGALERMDTGEPVGAAALREEGGLVCALESGFAVADAFGGRLRRLAAHEGAAPDVRMNDGKCDPAGRFWAGTMAYDFRPGAGALYRLDPDGTVTRMLDGVTISNGLDWTSDGAVMYYIDTPRAAVEAFDFDAGRGTISGRRTVVKIPEGAGLPDGMTLDAEGRIWVALWGGGAVRCYSPEGKLEEVIEVPAPQTTSCCFGGADFGELYITSARGGLSEAALAEAPLSGAVFVARPGVRGRAARRFGRRAGG
ncbi:MAG: SMP-30/gluconolactonase/LRE family protein [Bryobacteraceae bacterium]|nr:SMP-30/gluconolactonase/LRE family protein [Bryobacteraceae bacterium]